MSEALAALETLRKNIRSKDGKIWRQGIRDNDKTRAALTVLMDFASAALEQPSTAEALEHVFTKLLEAFESYEPGTADYAACSVADTLLLQLFPEYKDVQKKVRAKRIREEG